MMSDESENDGVYMNSYENDIYYKKYKLLLERCEAMQKYNEKLVFRCVLKFNRVNTGTLNHVNYRIQQVNKIVERRYKEVEFMKNRLSTVFDEDWKTVPKTEIKIEEEVDVKPKPTLLPLPHMKIKEEKPDDCE